MCSCSSCFTPYRSMYLADPQPWAPATSAHAIWERHRERKVLVSPYAHLAQPNSSSKSLNMATAMSTSAPVQARLGTVSVARRTLRRPFVAVPGRVRVAEKLQVVIFVTLRLSLQRQAHAWQAHHFRCGTRCASKLAVTAACSRTCSVHGV